MFSYKHTKGKAGIAGSSLCLSSPRVCCEKPSTQAKLWTYPSESFKEQEPQSKLLGNNYMQYDYTNPGRSAPAVFKKTLKE